jgi:hypothetical protein
MRWRSAPTFHPNHRGVRAWLRRWRCFYCGRFIWRRFDRNCHQCASCRPF